MAQNGNGKTVTIAVLVAIVGTGIAGWLTLGRTAVTRSEAVEIVRTQSPYLEDRATVRALDVQMDRLTAVVTDLTRQVAILNERLRVTQGASRE